MFGKKRIVKPQINNIKNEKIKNHPIIKQAINHDTDLIQVSSHNSVCEVCQRHEGKIFSLTGSDNRFPSLPDVPPFCDNCRHSIYVTFDSALEVSNTLKKFIEFSNDRTEKHPFLKNFIPISKRPRINLEDEIKLRKRVIAMKKKIITREEKVKNTKDGSSTLIKLKEEILDLNAEKDDILLKINTLGGWGKLLPKVKDDYKDIFAF